MNGQSSSDPIRVMQVVDSLDRGGAERVAVNMANLLESGRYASYLCTTRRDGPLVSELAPHVKYFCLDRKSTYDTAGLRRMVQLLNGEGIQVVHAHGSSLFVSRIATLLSRKSGLVWHDHYGGSDWSQRSAWLYRCATAGASVIAVNDSLAKWARDVLHVPADRVSYVPNWVEKKDPAPLVTPLPGTCDMRVVCVANLRVQKDHMTLLKAIEIVRRTIPSVHLLMVGEPSEARHAEYILSQMEAMNLQENVTYLGPRHDVTAILKSCETGVLSSASEGLPLALLEYGHAGLAVVTTDVGQCRAVLANGHAGILVPPSDPGKLACALIDVLLSPERRKALGAALRDHVHANYDSQQAVERIGAIYQGLIERNVA